MLTSDTFEGAAMSKTQIEQEIQQVVTQPDQGVRPLEGHTSEAQAYLVEDYPYGFRLRTQARYWLEHHAKRGWRFVHQTLNPKTGRWNKSKASTYAEWGGAMYLDSDGHVQWLGIGPYSSDRDILSFVQTFPHAGHVLSEIVPQKLRLQQGRIEGRLVWTINGVAQPTSEADQERLRSELETWQQIARLIK